VPRTINDDMKLAAARALATWRMSVFPSALLEAFGRPSPYLGPDSFHPQAAGPAHPLLVAPAVARRRQ